jgi:hypothetical protein
VQEESDKRIILVSSTSVVRNDDDQQFLNNIITTVNKYQKFLGIEAVQEGTEPVSEDSPAANSNFEPEFAIVGDRSQGTGNRTIYTMILLNLSSGSTVATEQLPYTTVDGSTINDLTTIVDRMISLIPDITRYPTLDESTWKTNWFYPYIRAGGSFKWYDGGGRLSAVMDYEVALGTDILFASFSSGLCGLAIGIEGFVSHESVKFIITKDNEKEDINVTWSDVSAAAFLKFNFTPRQFVFSLYAGPFYTWYFGTNKSVENSNPLGIIIGLDEGIRVDKGIISLCMRFGYDFNPYKITIGSESMLAQRMALSISLSYTIGLLGRPQKTVTEMNWNNSTFME